MTDYVDRVSGTAETQYGDLIGTAAADRADSSPSGLQGLANRIAGKDAGWPIALDWYVDPRGEQTFVHVSLFTIPPEHGISNGDAARNWLREQGSEVEVNRYTTTDMTIDEFLSLFKRFSVVLALRDVNISQFNVVSSVEAEHKA